MLGAIVDGRYRVDAPIARGGMSTVYRGLDTRLDRPVAIKIMDPQFAADPAFVQRFEFEARAVARLSHPGLVAVYDHGRDGELAFLVMELVEGGTLRELLRERGPMPPHAAAAVMQPVLDALAVAHRAGLVHRDVKPENVLISDGGEVKIADFGLVRAVAASTTTSNSVILGTAAYLSPEQVTVGKGDARSDVYSAGILLFEVLTGGTPFTGDTSLSIAYQRIENDVPPPSSRIAGVPPQFDTLVRHAADRNPDARFANADAMAEALRSVSRTLHLPPYRVPAPSKSAEHLSAETLASPRPYAPEAPRTPETAMVAVPHGDVVRDAGPHQTRMVTTATARENDPEPPPPPPSRGFAFPDFDAERRKSRRTVIAWLLVILLLALAVGFGGWWMGSGRYTAVPATDGMSRTTAEAALEAADLTTTVRGTYSDTDPPDRLLGTDPVAGSRIAKGASVALLVSLGQPAVPSLAATSNRGEVEQALRDRTFKPVSGGEAFSTTAAVGTVAALDPPSGTTLPVGTTVKIVLSKGAPPVQVPNVAGASEAEARAALESVGISVGTVDTTFDENVDAGKAIATDPPAGQTVTAGSEITLSVSNAVPVPSVVANSVGTARNTLQALGLKVVVRQVAQTDRSFVLSQTPGAGERIEPGGTVTLVSLP
ncbi:serine/threonine protein kinase [Rhodococcoides trifolii]|uniref:non-specific serine/threonine protein kinase n=1 Tax=Rhodococcoides trifolii TaxID=908250 RepID=A0A917D298_9NOCA|nr:serine/threonine protein kinase [Rhodococcus trifolii]